MDLEIRFVDKRFKSICDHFKGFLLRSPLRNHSQDGDFNAQYRPESGRNQGSMEYNVSRVRC